MAFEAAPVTPATRRHRQSRSVYEPEAFQGRVDYAAKCILRGTDSRHRDTCFEMWDGELVVTALVRRCEKNQRLKDAIIKSWGGTFPQSWLDAAAKWSHLTRRDLPQAARELRTKRQAESDARAAQWEKEAAEKAARAAETPAAV